jgi:hypothetical protein
MNFRKTILAVSVAVLSLNALAGTAIAPANRIRIWEGSAVSFPDSQYTIGTTSAMGTIKTLKSNPTVINLLQNLNVATNTGGLDMIRPPGANLSSVSFNGTPHQRLSDNISTNTGECVAFARSMTGTKKTPSWYRGMALTDYVSWNGAGYVLNNWNTLQPGTMIAYFNTLSYYPKDPATKEAAGHVAIFLSWVLDSNGFVTGISVVDENLVQKVSINGVDVGGGAGLIQKHQIPWKCPTGKTCTNTNWQYNLRYVATSYHVVDVQ